MARRTTTPVKETAAGGEGPTLDVWIGQYKKNWNSIITSESFSHPAKFARGLLETIVEHALAEGWVKPGDHCLDPFGGIATGAYVCMSKGLRWTGVELEEHFHNLGQGCDCTGISKPDYARLYGRWPRMRYAHGHYLCPRCLAQVGQVTGERRPVQRIVRTHPRLGCDEVWAAARRRKPYTDVRPGPQPNTVEKTFTFQPLPFPDRRDGSRPPPRAQALFTAETASYARSSGVIPHTKPHHYVGNIEAWAAKGYTGATLLRGDSRRLTEVLAEAGLSISSPPYAQSLNSDNNGIDWSKTRHGSYEAKHGQHPQSSHATGAMNYGTAPANLGGLPVGSLDAALAPDDAPPQMDLLVSSSPYAASIGSGQSDGQHTGMSYRLTQGGNFGASLRAMSGTAYGTDPANLGNLPHGSLDLALTSPPYADGCTHTGGADPQPQHVQGGTLRYVHYGAKLAVTSPPWENSLAADVSHKPAFWEQLKVKLVRDGKGHAGSFNATGHYGMTDGQLGAMPPGSVAAVVPGDLVAASPPYEGSEITDHRTTINKTLKGIGPSTRKNAGSFAPVIDAYKTPGTLGNTQGTTFWSAARAIIEQVYLILKPGAHAIWVTKHYIRDGTLVDFPGDWEKLCRACGFETVHIHLAMLVERRVETHLFEGSVTYEQWKESFFRRIARRKSGVGIEFETVICMVKPLPSTPMPPDEAWEQLPLVEVGAGADCSVSSPAYGNSVNAQSHGIDWSKAGPATGNRQRGDGSQHEATLRAQLAYGHDPAQVGAMKVGSLDATLSISSPPYNLPISQDHNGSKGGTRGTTPSETGAFVKHGSTPGQLEGMAPGSLDLALSSPPYAGSTTVDGRAITDAKTHTRDIGTMAALRHGYSTNPVNLGNMPEGHTP